MKYHFLLLSGVNLITLFGCIFTHSFCKLDLFIALPQMLRMFIIGLAFKNCE
jgi:hypothetical protein